MQQFILVLGAPGVGKSSFAYEWSYHGNLSHTFDPSEYLYHQQCLLGYKPVPAVVSLCDLHATRSPMHDSLLRQATACIIMYSITSMASFRAVPEIVAAITSQLAPSLPGMPASFPMMLVGNKTDLEASRVVTTTQGRELAEQLGCAFEETSAANFSNMRESITNLAQEASRYWQRVRDVRRDMEETNSDRRIHCIMS